MLALALTGCGKNSQDDVLSTINREEPYTATLPSVTTQIETDDTTEDMILVGTISGVSSSVNIRSEASTSGTILGSAQAGEQYLVTEENAYEGWHRIDYNGQDGFIYADYLSITACSADMLGTLQTGNNADTSNPGDTTDTPDTAGAEIN